MLLNPDLRMQATKVYFLRKLNQDSPLPPDLNDNTVQTVEVHNHLGFSLIFILILIFILKTK